MLPPVIGNEEESKDGKALVDDKEPIVGAFPIPFLLIPSPFLLRPRR